ncbi:MAG TPA: nuclear transport factor 2 family protein [Patescibacteria group bacterium]|nr:nuclear transport factor 2 family protein [Patescibacteria group bacterium]
MNVEELAQAQLDAYNAGDIEAFLKPYSPQIELFLQSTGERFCRGLDEMRERYEPFFKNNPQLHCKLLSRIIQGDFAIDQEHVTGLADGREMYAIAIYECEDGLIRKAWFIK